MLRIDDNAYKGRVAINLLFIVVGSTCLNLLRLRYTCMVCPLTQSVGVNLLGIVDACMRVLSIGISQDFGRGMRYRLHLVAFTISNASFSINVSSIPQRRAQPGSPSSRAICGLETQRSNESDHEMHTYLLHLLYPAIMV
jgi:hypothetical protein